MTAKRKQFHTDLARWYAQHGRRDLPWRTRPTPYTVYISEIMLQQTQVSTVLERFYFPFLERFPSLSALAAAEEEEVLKAWQGLGYYSRARNLHKAARLAAPVLPDTLEGLLALPGIGRNTAHAVMAFGFGKPYAVMEANLKRVLCRIFALPSPTDAQLWKASAALLDTAQPFDYNQAMMDVGALVCTPKAPRCGDCPAALICKGKAQPERYPQPKKAKAVPTRRPQLVIAQDAGGRIYSMPRTTRFLGGLYGFVELPEDARDFEWQGKRYALGSATYIGMVTHSYSHFRLEAALHHVRLKTMQNGPEWKSPEELTELPLSKADEKALTMVMMTALATPRAEARTLPAPKSRTQPSRRAASPSSATPRRKRASR